MRNVFALRQIHNPSVHQQFPKLTVIAKKQLEKKTEALSLFGKQSRPPAPLPSFAYKHTSKPSLDPICSFIRNTHHI